MKIYPLILFFSFMLGSVLQAQIISGSISGTGSRILQARPESQGSRGVKMPGSQNQAFARQGSTGFTPTPVTSQAITNCPQDTIEYTLIKMAVVDQNGVANYDSARALDIGFGSATGMGQWYPAPQSITVSGFTFISVLPTSAGNTLLPVTCSIYAAGLDSLPTGAPLSLISVNVDTAYANAFRRVNFLGAVTIPAGNGYVIVVENTNNTPAITFCNDYTTTNLFGVGNGINDNASCGKTTGAWMHGLAINVNGVQFNADMLFYPHVTYTLTAAATTPTTCFGNLNVAFTNTSSPIYSSRFYNFYAFLVSLNGLFGPPPIWGDSTFVWNYGVTPANDTVRNGSNNYPGANPYTVTMRGNLARWRGQQFCTDTWTFNLGPDPVATVTPTGPTSFCSSSSVVLTTGVAASYQWFNNSVAISGATASSYQAFAAGTYTVRLTNSLICEDSSLTPIVVTLLPGATANMTAAGATTICNGSTATLNVSGGTSQQWYFNGTLIAGATNTSYVAASAGSYTSKVFNSSGCPDSTLTPIIISVLASTIVPGGPTYTCPPGGVVLNSGAVGASYQWLSNGAVIPGQTINFYPATASGSYQLAVDFGGGCLDTSIVTVVYIGPMDASIPVTGATTFCQGSTLTLTPVSSGAASYQWYNNNVAIPGATASTYQAGSSGTFTVTVASPPGPPTCFDSTAAAVVITVNPTPVAAYVASAPLNICPAGSVTLTASGGAGYQWTRNGSPIPGANTSIYTVSGLNPDSTYNVIVTNGPCPDTLNTPIRIDTASLVASLVNAGTYTICSNAPLMISALPSGAQNYQWYNNGIQVSSGTSNVYAANQAGNFTVKVTNPGCQDSTFATVSLTVNPAPTATINASGPLAFCSGDTVTLTTSGGVQYQWYRGGGALAGATNTTLQVHTSGMYAVKVTNGLSCSDSTTTPAMVTVSPSPSAALVVSGPLNFCVGNSVQLTAPGTIQSGYTYTWTKDNGIINGATAPQFSAQSSGTYSVIVTLGICVDTLTNGVVVLVDSLPPLAGFTPVISGTQVQLTNTSRRANTYSWDMGDGTIYTTVNIPSHTYQNGGIYDVVLYAYNACGQDSFRLNLQVDRSGDLTVFEGLSVYPNPSSGKFWIQLPVQGSDSYQVLVKDLEGRNVYQQVLDFRNGNAQLIDISTQSSGLYLLEIIHPRAVSRHKIWID